MFMRMFNKKAQTTAEYAVLLGLVIAAVVAMQVYVKRGFQGKIKEETDKLGAQYEPEYLGTDFTSNRDTAETETTIEGGGVTRTVTKDTSTRTGEQIYKAPETTE